MAKFNCGADSKKFKTGETHPLDSEDEIDKETIDTQVSDRASLHTDYMDGSSILLDDEILLLPQALSPSLVGVIPRSRLGTHCPEDSTFGFVKGESPHRMLQEYQSKAEMMHDNMKLLVENIYDLVDKFVDRISVQSAHDHACRLERYERQMNRLIELDLIYNREHELLDNMLSLLKKSYHDIFMDGDVHNIPDRSG
jgi:hypothetical protein